MVGADKGFNFSQTDEAFVCQKKNHFQVTCQIQVQGDPHYVKSSEGFKKVNNFCLHFYGVKVSSYCSLYVTKIIVFKNKNMLVMYLLFYCPTFRVTGATYKPSGPSNVG